MVSSLILARHNQTKFFFREQDKSKSFVQGSRDKIETFAITTQVKSKNFIKQTRIDSRPETLVLRSQVWFIGAWPSISFIGVFIGA